jgi:hypothetical protein
MSQEEQEEQEKQEEQEEQEEQDCWHCRGTGEGSNDYSVCKICNGTGVRK